MSSSIHIIYQLVITNGSTNNKLGIRKGIVSVVIIVIIIMITTIIIINSLIIYLFIN